MKRFILLSLLCFCFIGLAFGQHDQKLSTKNKKAIKFYQQGGDAYTLGHYDDAIPLMQQAIKEDTSFIEAHIVLADLYEKTGKPEDAVSEDKKVINLNPAFFPSTYFTIGRIDVSLGHYTEALRFLQIFQQLGTRDPNMNLQTPLLIQDCDYGAWGLKHPVPFNPQNMGDAINTPMWEYFPTLTADGLTFMFTRRLQTDNYDQEDIYVSYKVNGQWTKAVNLGSPPNTPQFNEGAPTISADGHLLIFASERPGGFGSMDLYFTLKRGDQWTEARNLGRPVNSGNWESQPCLATDGRSLYFVRADKRSITSNMDIFLTHLDDSGYWSSPQRLGDSINTAADDCYPFIAADNQTLYFCSDGWPGMGGMDIFVSRKKDDGSWGTPMNLGYPINSPKDETSIVVDPGGQLAYFSSDRQGGYGGQDIYSFALNDAVKPTPVTYMKGKVYDAKTKLPVQAAFNLIDLSTGKVVIQSYSSAHDGTFLVCIPLNKNYALNANARGYLFYSETFAMKDSNASKIHPFMINVPLQPIDTGAKIVLKNVFFATNKYDLEPQSQIELDKLVGFLNANPTVKIEISGHTDNQGTPQSNIILSKNRAKAVYQYLVDHNIAADRLTYKGYGQTRPIADNSTEEGRAQNRRTEMKIVGK